MIFDSRADSAGFGYAGSGSINIVVGNNTNRAVFAWLGFQTNGGATFGTSMTCGGEAMTKFPGVAAIGGNPRYKELWWLSNPPVGSQSVAFTCNDSNDKPYLSAVSYHGVHQSDPFNGRTVLATLGATADFPTPGGTINVSSAVGETCIDHMCNSQPNLSHTPGAGQTVREQNVDVSAAGGICQSDKAGVAGTTSMGWTINFADPFLYTGIAVKPVASGTTHSAGTAEAGSATDAAVVLQMLKPSVDSSVGNWTGLGGGTVFSKVDETARDDADYALSGVNPVDDGCLLKLSPGALPVAGPAGFHVLRYALSAIGTTSMATVKLWQGNRVTLVASQSHDTLPEHPTWAEYALVLSTAEMALITDPANLYYEVIGDPAN
jgi:hypothetical protein